MNQGHTQKYRSFSKISLGRLQSNILLGLVVATLLTQPVRVSADNTEDLLNVYGLTLGGPVKTELEQEMETLEQTILAMQSQEIMNKEYNDIMKQYVQKREELVNKVMTNIAAYQSNNISYAEYISENILDADIEDLLHYDSVYKSNNNSMNELLETMNNYTVDYELKDVNFNISEVESKLMDTRKIYVDALDTYDLGDVKNIKWIMPNERYLTSRYGYRVDPLNSSEIRFHAGADYRAPEGTPIGALFNGTVISAGWSDSIGYFVTVESGDNVKYLICHCSKLLVKEGQKVKQYDTIALSGGTGKRSTGPHLHLALYLNGVTYDVNTLFK